MEISKWYIWFSCNSHTFITASFAHDGQELLEFCPEQYFNLVSSQTEMKKENDKKCFCSLWMMGRSMKCNKKLSAWNEL